jgi:acyl-CoA dehydrogenase
VSALGLDTDVAEAARRIGAAVAGPAAVAVDRDARFPREAIEALREARMLGAFVPERLGGRGCALGELAAACEALGRYCASTAMIYAMHQIQVGCLVRHGLSSPAIRHYLAELAEDERLIASATSEVGVGGDVRRSLCAIEPHGTRFRVKKAAPVVSYAEDADDILLTARRHPDAVPGDQVLVLLRRANTRLTPTGDWNALGMRGTCSLGYTVEASGELDQIIGAPYAEISSQTMLPFSHVLWSALWLGLATDAVQRARAFVRAEARKTPGMTPPSALRLAEVATELGAMRATVHGGRAYYERRMEDTDALAGLGFALRMNDLKVSASRMVADIAGRALGVCGLAGYKSDTPYALGRHLRDAHGAALMIGNDRIWAANAAMLLVHKED